MKWYKYVNIFAKGRIVVAIYPYNKTPCKFFIALLDYAKVYFKGYNYIVFNKKSIILENPYKNNKSIAMGFIKSFKDNCVIKENPKVHYIK